MGTMGVVAWKSIYRGLSSSFSSSLLLMNSVEKDTHVRKN